MKHLFILLFLFNSLIISAQDDTLPAGKFSSALEYGYNYTYEHYGAAQVMCEFPTKTSFSAEVGFQAVTANIYAFVATARNTLKAKHGKWLIENTLLYRTIMRNVTKLYEMSLGVSGGYHCNYFSGEFGFHIKFIDVIKKFDAMEQRRPMIEPFNLYYSIEGRVRKDKSRWNLGVRISNFDDFQMERGMSPMFTLVSKFVPNKTKKHFYLWAEATLKPSGTFLLASNFYDVQTRVGISYLFNYTKN